MAGPYLKSGESIILTTDRVMIDTVEYDVILTSQRLALVDSGHASDQPQVIPFATVLSVKGGTTPAREPVITLTLVDPVGLEDARTLDLVFSQQPYEDRGAECDTWVKKLIEYIVSAKEEPERASLPQEPAKPPGMNPTVRRWSAPEAPQPRMEVKQESRSSSEELLSSLQQSRWEEPEREPAGTPDILEPEAGEEAVNDEIPGEQESAVRTEVPAKTGEPGPEAQKVTVPEMADETPEEIVEDKRGEEPVPPEPGPVYMEAPALPADEEDPTASPLPDDKQRLMEKEEQILLGKEAGDPSPSVATETAPVPPAGLEVRSALPDTVNFPVISDEDSGPEESGPAAEQPEEKVPAAPEAPSPLSRAVSPRGIALIVAAVIIVACIAGAALVLTSSGENHEEIPSSPTVTPVVTVTTVATQQQLVIPDTGVWVRVIYNGTYYGKYGNPGELREVRGTGDQFYSVKNGTGLVQVSFQKLDYSGDTITVEVYNAGTMVTQATKRAPQGTITFLVDPATGTAPYVPVATGTA